MTAGIIEVGNKEIRGNLTVSGTIKTIPAAIFITNATGAGAISGKTWAADTSPAEKVLTAFESDNDSVTVHVEVDAGLWGAVGSGWQPVVTVKGGTTDVEVTNLARMGSYSRRFSGSATIDAPTDATIYATSGDGGQSQDVDYERSLDPPAVLTAIWEDQGTNADPYPGVQTQFKQDDNMQLSGTCEEHADEIYVQDFESTTGEGLQGPYAASGGTWTAANVKAGNAGPAASSHVKVYAKVTGGTAGADFTSSETVECDQTSPTFGSPSVEYPAGQEAVKDAETVDVTLAHTNAAGGDTYAYTDNGTDELTIPSPTVYASPKENVARASGDYRETGNNYKLTVTRTTLNGKSASAYTCVRIAHTFPVITVGRWSGMDGANKRLRTDDGTNNYYDHQIMIMGTQARLSTDTPEIQGPPVGTFQGSWVYVTTTRYARNLRIADADILAGGQGANDYAWNDSTTVSWVNRAGKETTTVTTGNSFSVGGFDTRTINMGPITGGDPPYTHTGDIGVPVVVTAKTTVVNTSKGGTPTQAYEANVTHHEDPDSTLNNYWTTVAGLPSCVFDDYTKYFHCSDKKFYESITAPGGFNCTIEESA